MALGAALRQGIATFTDQTGKHPCKRTIELPHLDALRRSVKDSTDHSESTSKCSSLSL